MDVLVDVCNITKKYGRVEAVQNVSFKLYSGEFVGLVGPNGAGKSTTIKLLSGQLFPTSGTILVDGVQDDLNELRRRIGYVPEFPELYGYLTAREMLQFVQELRGGGDLDWALELTGLGTDADRQIREYSQGMRRKTAIACALIAKPKVLILDEALNGLDPPSSSRVLKALEQLRKDGHMILLSTHVLETLERVATRVLMMESGLIQADLNEDDLKKMYDFLPSD